MSPPDDKVVTSEQYRADLARLQLTQVAAAKLLHASERTGRRWVERGITGPAVILLRLLRENVIRVAQRDDHLELERVPPPKPKRRKVRKKARKRTARKKARKRTARRRTR